MLSDNGSSRAAAAPSVRFPLWDQAEFASTERRGLSPGWRVAAVQRRQGKASRCRWDAGRFVPDLIPALELIPQDECHCHIG